MLDLQAGQINLTTTLSERPTDSLNHSQQETAESGLKDVNQRLRHTLTTLLFSAWSLSYRFSVICKWCKKDPNQAPDVSTPVLTPLQFPLPNSVSDFNIGVQVINLHIKLKYLFYFYLFIYSFSGITNRLNMLLHGKIKFLI